MGAGFDAAALLAALKEELRTIFAVLVAAVLVALIASLLTTKQYQAIAVIQLMPRAGREVQSDAVVKNDDGGYMESRDRARTQIQIILSRTVRAEVARRYLAADHHDLPEGEEAGTLKDLISAGPREDTQLVEVRVLHPNPESAATLANLVAEVYSEQNLSQRTDAARETTTWLDQRSGEYAEALRAATAKVMSFKAEHDLVDTEQGDDGVSTRMGALERALGEATTKRVLLEGKLAEHQRLLARGQTEVLAGMIDDPSLTALSRERAKIVAESAETLSRYGELHPEHQRAVQHITGVDALIAQEVRRNIQGEKAEVETLKRQEADIGAELNGVRAERLDKQRLQKEFETLLMEEDQARTLYGSLGERGAEVELQARTRLNDVRLVDPALPPGKPLKPNLALNLAVALAAGLMGGMGLGLLRQRMNPLLLRTEEIEDRLGLPLLGALPTVPKVEGEPRALYAHLPPRSRVAETLRSIRAVIQATASAEGPRRLLVTSCLEGEGKSDLATGLALSFAQLGTPTLLVDADLRRPALHRIFGVEAVPGLADAVGLGTAVRQFVRATDVPDLHLLTAGTPADAPTEILSSEELAATLKQLGEHYPIIIIDSPPVALVSDALTLSRHVDGLVFVIRRARVPEALGLRTLHQLEQVGARILGVLMNDLPPREDRYRQASRYYDDRPRGEGRKGR